MTSATVYTRSVSHGAGAMSASTVVAEKLNANPNVSNGKDLKVRFEDHGKGVAVGGDDDASVPAKLRHDQYQRGKTMLERSSLPSRLPETMVIPKDRQTGELPAFGEHHVHQRQQMIKGGQPVAADSEVQENRRLRGKLKWLFEQDRMYWESNSAKNSRRGSPEVDRYRDLESQKTGTNTRKQHHPHGGEPNATGNDVTHQTKSKAREAVLQRKPQSGDSRRLPRQNNDKHGDGAQTAREEADTFGRDGRCSNNLGLAKAMPWTISSTTARFWSRGKSKAAQDSKTVVCPAETKTQASDDHPPPEERRKSVDHHHNRRVASNESVTLMSSLDLGREGFAGGDVVAGHQSGDATEASSSDEDEGNATRDADVGTKADREGSYSSLKDVKHQAACLKAKCDVLAKEKAHAVREWEKSCMEIDEAAQMAQALRTAIETLLEASAGGSRFDLKARQDILEEQTEALKTRMEKLRRKNSEGLLTQSQVSKRSSKTLHERVDSSQALNNRVDSLKTTSDGRNLASPEIPRDTEHKVEALRARLEKLMLATNSRVSDEQGQGRRTGKAQAETVHARDDVHVEPQSNEGELKMKGWLNSLSAELTTEELSPVRLTQVCETCHGEKDVILTEREVKAMPISEQITPVASKQASPVHSVQEPYREGLESSGGASYSEDTTKMVIHKIAEEVRLEAEQWFQVQELLGRVGEDMKSLQEACCTWERRAILAEAQVASMHQEGQEKCTKEFGDAKVAELQREMLRLRETVEDVRTQLGRSNGGVDPSKWFEAAHNFGYAFMPVSLPHVACDCKGKCESPRGREDASESNLQLNQKGIVAAMRRLQHPSSSANSSAAPSTISSCANTPSESERWRKPLLVPQPWAGDVARAEEEEIKLTNTPPPPSTKEVTKFGYVSSAVKEIMNNYAGGVGRLLQEKQEKLLRKAGSESSEPRGDALLQMQSSARERSGNLQHQDEQVARYSNFNGPGSRRSPLRDVLENSTKENKRPF